MNRRVGHGPCGQRVLRRDYWASVNGPEVPGALEDAGPSVTGPSEVRDASVVDTLSSTSASILRRKDEKGVDFLKRMSKC